MNIDPNIIPNITTLTVPTPNLLNGFTLLEFGTQQGIFLAIALLLIVILLMVYIIKIVINEMEVVKDKLTKVFNYFILIIAITGICVMSACIIEIIQIKNDIQYKITIDKVSLEQQSPEILESLLIIDKYYDIFYAEVINGEVIYTIQEKTD